MANEEHLAILREGVEAWNEWRYANKDVLPDLAGADLVGADLRGANLRGANLSRANLSEVDLRGVDLRGVDLSEADLIGAWLSEADLTRADLRGADLTGARLFKAHLSGAHLSEADLTAAKLTGANLTRVDLSGASLSEADLAEATLIWADLSGADLSGAYLRGADLTAAKLREKANLSRANLTRAKLNHADAIGLDLSGADLAGADLREADLSGADLTGTSLIGAQLVETTIKEASLSGAHVYGVAAWNLIGEPKDQNDLVVTPRREPAVTVDDLETAQFVYLMLHNEKLRRVIDTIGNKGVLILGRFGERKHVLDRLRDRLRALGWVPMVFDFEKPVSKDFTETVRTLAGMSAFIIADITASKSVPQEAQGVVPDYMVPFIPIIQEGEEPWSMFADLWIKYREWVLAPLEYPSIDDLIPRLNNEVVKPALEKRTVLLARRAEEMVTRSLGEDLDER